MFPLVTLAVALRLPSGAAAQAKPSKPIVKANASASQAEVELARRIKTADAARASGNTKAIGDANRKVIALALRELGHLRLSELLSAQAVELYRNSLSFEDAVDSRADLANAINTEAKAKTTPTSPPDADPFARPDASTFSRAKLSPEQRTAAEGKEIQLRLVLGASLNDLATSEAARNQYGMALTHLQQAEKWNSATTGLARNLGFCAFKVGDYPEAIRTLSRALEEQPQDAPVRAMLGMSYFGSNKYADAAKTFEPLGDRGMQDTSVGYAWATSLARTGDLKKAADVLNHFENSNLSPDALLLVGQLWTEMTDYQHAVSVFQKVLLRDPSLPKAHFFEGLAYLKWEKWNEAASDFQAELALVPGDLDAKYTLGFIRLQQGRVDEALAFFNEVLAAEPNHANAQYQIGKIMLDRGRLDDAITHLEIAARLDPQADYIHYQLQVAYRKRSRIAEADRELEIYKQLKSQAREQSSSPKQNP
ncbi:tetratricopeptide repeat protein [Candidatus Korobacter versatilis]|uniref:tetratricopeptide repeat protein n=1 Tax=Candidatus Korobacter versatilis TaxID=658062 RepID=UPI0002F933E0|nr:tetratricopeptide repeat protein [Candidatus Koribacter versatilis]